MVIEHESETSDYLAHLICRIRESAFSKEDISVVRQHLLDAVSSAFIGCRSKAFEDLNKLCPRFPEGCAWPGSGRARLNPMDAGLIWAFAINASVFEDGSREGACHPAAAVIPAVIAFAAAGSWDRIDTAAIAGYDVMVRLARGGNPEFIRKGFHPTAITAPFGAAAAASVLLDHDLSKSRNALSMAALAGAGLMSAFKSGPTQPLQVAWAVRSGILAALMAGAGHTGYGRIFEEGFYPAYLGREPSPPVAHPFAHDYAIKGSYLKRYPGCRHLHPTIDALGKILKENRINPIQIGEIQVGTYRTAIETEIDSLRNRGDAYFNIPYALAALAVLGKNDWDAFDEKHFTNENIIGLMKRIKLAIDPELERRYPDQRGAVVKVHMMDGNTFSEAVMHPLGEPENPLPISATREKFQDAAGSFLSEKGIELIESMLNVSGPAVPPQAVFEAVSENRQAR